VCVAPSLVVFVGPKGAPGEENVPRHHPRILPPGEAVGSVACAQTVAFTAATAKR
jgi:hypothetical protein